MIRYRFADADRERYGLPEVCEYDLKRPRLSEVRALGRQAGMTIPDLSTKIKAGDWEALGALFWLVALRCGATVPWEEFDVDLDAVEMEQVTEGNLPAPDGASNE